MFDKLLSCKIICWFKLIVIDLFFNKRKVYYLIMLIGFKFKGKKIVYLLY